MKLSRGLSLAAAPTFAGMAVLNGLSAVEPAGPICGSMTGSVFGGMTVMYALMAAFHLGPWFALTARRSPQDPQHSSQ